MRTLGKRVYRKVSRVRISYSPQLKGGGNILPPPFNCEEIVASNSIACQEIRTQGRGRETGVSRGGSIETYWFQGVNSIHDEFVISYSPQNNE